MKPSYREVVENAQAMQRRFSENTRRQLAVANRLSAQRDALADIAEAFIVLIPDKASREEWLVKLEAAKKLDPDPEVSHGPGSDSEAKAGAS